VTASTRVTAKSTQVTAKANYRRVFFALVRRDVLVTRGELGTLIAQGLTMPFLLLFIFGKVVTGMGMADESYAQVLYPGMIAMVTMAGALQSSALPLVIDFATGKEIEDRLLAPVPTWLVAVEKIVFAGLRGMFTAALMVPIVVLVLGPQSVTATGVAVAVVTVVIGGLLGAAIKGAIAVIPRQFSVSNFWRDIRRHRATATYLLGAMANFLQRQPRSAADADHTLQKILMCPLLPDLDDFVARFGVRVATAYGSTEVNAPIAMPLGAPVSNNQIVGKVRSDLFEVMIIDDDDLEVPAGVTGQIAVRPKIPGVTMLGYWQQPEATVAMWRNLWLHSGDAGHRDTEGRLYFTDRLRDTIRRRGENISSMEVEGIINQHPDVFECAVYPVRSEHGEDEVMVSLVLKPERKVAPEAIIAFLEPRMPRFMVPRFIDIVETLPKTPTGKVRKHLLRDAGITASSFDREPALPRPRQSGSAL